MSRQPHFVCAMIVLGRPEHEALDAYDAQALELATHKATQTRVSMPSSQNGAVIRGIMFGSQALALP